MLNNQCTLIRITLLTYICVVTTFIKMPGLLTVKQENHNTDYCFTVAILKSKDIVGHVP